MIRILFVCMGNICRSPLAQGAFERLVKENGLENEISADSAGTGAWHIGDPPDERAMESAARRGLDISGQKARRISSDDFDAFDFILTMDETNLRAVARLGSGRAEVRPFLEYAKNSPETEVPDPYYGGDGGFDFALDLVEDASAGLLADIKKRLGNRD